MMAKVLLLTDSWNQILEMDLYIEVRTKDGQLLSARRDIMKGELEDPVSDEELEQKFISLATDKMSADRVDQLWQMMFRLDELMSVSELTRSLRAD